MMRYLITLVLVATAVITGLSQEALKPRSSPLAMTTARSKATYIKVTYSQPHKRNREVFGNLVPFGQVWRMGANEATELTTTKDIIVNNILLKAGTYSLFTIPEKDKWTIIINADLGLWGSYNYNARQDVFRFTVPTTSTGDVVFEPFTISFDQRTDVADLLIMWDKTKVSIPVKFIN
jgi:hypothetical protein